jgi:hypothetical protein
MKRPPRTPSVADLIHHLKDHYGQTRADLIPLLRTPSRVREVMRGKRAQHGDGAASARPFPLAGRFAPSTSEEVAAPTFHEASGSLN